MKLNEALLTARNKRTVKVQMIERDGAGNYTVREVPDGIAFIVLPNGRQPIPVDVEANMAWNDLVLKAVTGKAERVAGIKVKKRAV